MTSPIISAEQVRDALGAIQLIDARQDPAAYAAGHLPGAIHADLNRDLSTATSPCHDPKHGGRHPLPDCATFGSLLDSWGITPDTDVVVYDDQGGAIAAARVWWMLRAIGHHRTRVLDGGWQQACRAGLPTTAALPALQPATSTWNAAWALPTVDLDELERLVADPSWLVLDARSEQRYRGEQEPLDPVAGHIPGAHNLYYAHNLTADGLFKSPQQLRDQYTAALADRAPTSTVTHCGSGVTACHTLLAMSHAGLDGAALYVGSFSEWCRRDKPIGKGN